MLDKFTETLKDYLPAIGHKIVLQWVECWLWNSFTLQVLRLPERTGNSAPLRIRTVCWSLSLSLYIYIYIYTYIYIYSQRNLVMGYLCWILWDFFLDLTLLVILRQIEMISVTVLNPISLFIYRKQRYKWFNQMVQFSLPLLLYNFICVLNGISS